MTAILNQKAYACCHLCKKKAIMAIIRQKNANVSLFIIMGLLIIFGTALIFMLFSDAYDLSVLSSADAKRAKSYVDLCLADTATRGLIAYGRDGGLISKESMADETRYPTLAGHMRFISSVPAKGEPGTLDVQDAKAQLEQYVSSGIGLCLNDLKKSFGQDIYIGQPKTELTLIKNKVIFHLEMPMTVTDGSRTVRMSDFSAEFPLRLEDMLDSARSIISSEKNFDMNLLSSTGFSYDIFTFVEDRQLIVISDPDSEVSAEPYRFSFVIEKR